MFNRTLVTFLLLDCFQFVLFHCCCLLLKGGCCCFSLSLSVLHSLSVFVSLYLCLPPSLFSLSPFHSPYFLYLCFSGCLSFFVFLSLSPNISLSVSVCLSLSLIKDDEQGKSSSLQDLMIKKQPLISTKLR